MTGTDSLTNYKEEEIDTLPISKLKELIANANGSTGGLFEKSEYIEYAKKLRASMQALAKPNHEEVREIKIDYYELLGVSKKATTSEITKAYYKLAKEYHPDKNKNDLYAEEMFKKVSEAYQVLTDPEKRERYDKYGMDAMNEMTIDPLDLFRMIFGGGMFQNYFGDLSFYDAFSQQMSQENPTNPEELQLDQEKMAKKREERIVSLTKQLIIIIEPYVQGNKVEFESNMKNQAKEMAAAPGGADLLSLLGYIYIQEAKQHSLFGFIHEISEKGHKAKELFSTISAAVKMQNSLKEESMDGSEPAQENVLREGLKLIWKIGRLDIDSAVREVCERVLDKKAEKRKLRVEAVKSLGKIFEKVGKENHGSGDISEDIFKTPMSPPQHPANSPKQTTTTTTTTSTTSSTTNSTPTSSTTSPPVGSATPN
ncbi:hypothetical protein CYY_005785 [Polysphondylium violaceum]|uniref:J domain-containing protein n=1 Tax=Polysphondylium violaceum TaxID=133409 RepID=A0A8J4PTP1_9MYCE|nr:hypothetical protein CYY_005785 [Polysphondylium violaceum]